MQDVIETKIDTLAMTVASISAAVEKGFAAVAADIADLDDKLDDLTLKIEEHHIELRSKLAGLEHRLDIEANIRQDQNIPGRLADLEIKAFGTSRAPKASA